MQEYAYWRRQAVILQEQSGFSWGDPENQALRESWAGIRQDLKNKNVRWAEIANRWLSNDDEPKFVGGNLDVSTEALGEGIPLGS